MAYVRRGQSSNTRDSGSKARRPAWVCNMRITNFLVALMAVAGLWAVAAAAGVKDGKPNGSTLQATPQYGRSDSREFKPVIDATRSHLR